MARIGVVGAGRVGAVLSAALRAAGHEVVAAAGQSPATLQRAADLLPGVPVAKPTDVARSCDLLLLTVPDDMLENVATTLVGAGAIRAGQLGAVMGPYIGLGCLLLAIWFVIASQKAPKIVEEFPDAGDTGPGAAFRILWRNNRYRLGRILSLGASVTL